MSENDDVGLLFFMHGYNWDFLGNHIFYYYFQLYRDKKLHYLGILKNDMEPVSYCSEGFSHLLFQVHFEALN